MKRGLLLLTLSVAVLAWTLPAAAQTPAMAEMQMYQLVLVKHGPDWKGQDTKEGMDIRMEVIEKIKQAAKAGMVVSAGLVNDETDVEFILVLNLETKYEALELLNQAPHVKDRMYQPEVYSWFASKMEVVRKQQ